MGDRDLGKAIFWAAVAGLAVFGFVYFRRGSSDGVSGFLGALPAGTRPPRLNGSDGFRTRLRDYPVRSTADAESETGLLTND